MKRLVISKLIVNDEEVENLTQTLNTLDEIASNDEIPEAFDARLIHDALDRIMDNMILESKIDEGLFINPTDDDIIDYSYNIEDDIEDYMPKDDEEEG